MASFDVLVFCYLFTVTVLSLTGNAFVLTCANNYRASDTDKVSIMFIKNLAISDILCTLLFVVPSLANTDRPGYPAICRTAGVLAYIPAEAEILLILLISGYKVWRCMRPFRAPLVDWGTPGIRCLGLGVWLVAALLTMVPLHATQSVMIYDEELRRCVYDRSQISIVRLCK